MYSKAAEDEDNKMAEGRVLSKRCRRNPHFVSLRRQPDDPRCRRNHGVHVLMARHRHSLLNGYGDLLGQATTAGNGCSLNSSHNRFCGVNKGTGRDDK
jgi:hypothetical protein